MEGERPVELYDPKKYLDTYFYTLRMPHEQPQLLETLLITYQEFLQKVGPISPSPRLMHTCSACLCKAKSFHLFHDQVISGEYEEVINFLYIIIKCRSG